MSFVLTFPVTTPTTTLTLKSVFVSLTNVQATPVQILHVAQGGRMFVFSPGTTPFINRLLPLEIRSLHEANDGSFTGWAALNTFILTTLLGSTNPFHLVDPDGTAYNVRYVRGLENMQEVQQGRWSGTLLFREEAP